MVKKFSDYKKVFDIDISQLIYEILLMPSIQKDIIEFNQEQMQQGKDSNDETIITLSAEEQNQGNVYSIVTIPIRLAAGLQVDNVDLNFSGAFYNTFTVKVSKTEIEVIANFNKGGDDIRDNFDNKYEFLGLNENGLDNFVWASIFPELQKALRAQVQENLKKL